MIHLRFLGLFVVMLTMFSMSALANNNKDYYSKVTAGAVGEGKVYASKTQTNSPAYTAPTSSDTKSENTNSAPTHTYYLYAQANEGAEFIGWYDNANCTGDAKSNSSSYTVTINAESTTESSPTTATYYALFKPFFKFSATANKINGSYGTTTAAVTAAKVLGSSTTSTSASTTATFTATPNNNCTFEGWYTDATHTTLVSTNPSYSTTITNSEKGSTYNHILYAWFKSNQTLSWSNTYEPNVIYEQTSVGAATATASSGLTVSYNSSTPTVASVNSYGDVTGVSVSPTAVTITASQAGNDEFNAATSITRSFTVISKYAATFEVDGFTGISPTIHVDDTPTITLKDVDTDFAFNSSDPTVVGIARNGNVIILTAHKVGTSTVTLNQPDNATHSAASATYTITVSKVPNNLAVSLASESAEVDGTINVTFSDRNNTGTAIVGTITEQSLSSMVNNGTDVITYANGVITACNAGTAKITFTQAATDKYVGFNSSTYTITVTKKTNPITITLAGGSSTNIKLKYGATATLTYSSEHSGTSITVNRVEGNYTTYSNGTIKAGNSAGTDRYEIRQAETYKYAAGLATFIIRVNNTDEAVGYVLTDANGGDWSTISSYTPAALSGPGDVLSFDAYRTTAGGNYFYVMYSTNNGTSWSELANPSLSTSYSNYSYTLPDGVTNVKFETRTGATLHKYVKNIYVTRRTYVKATASTTAFGTVYIDASPKPSATVTVNYSTTNGGNVVVSSNNVHFVVSSTDFVQNKTEFATTNNSHGTKTFTVTYNPDPDQLGEESAVITVGDLFYSQQITLTATASKHANTLAVIGTQYLKVDDVVSNVYSSKNSMATLDYALSREGVIEYDPTTNKITAVGAGTATLTLSQAANDYYFGTSKTVTVNVSKYDQTISWDNVLSDEDRVLEVGDVLTTNTATASSGLSVSYSSSNSSALEANASTGVLTANDGGANIVITATQAGNYKYNEVSITRYFTVMKRIDPTITTTLSESGINYFPIANPDITIRCNATITESAFTITGNSEGYVSTSFASNTLTLRALKEGGTVTVTLTRAQDDGFYAVNKTYIIEVTKPVLTLDPASAPNINYSEYSTVTLSRTLKAGYSTIALPFATTVAALTNRSNTDDWVAQLATVTYNDADGYTLYFNKVEGGTISANQPYILHLAAQVDEPTWENVTLSAPTPVTVYPSAGYGNNIDGATGTFANWSMSSNFTVMDMEGLYGIVNTAGSLQLGGSGSTLKAFTAYITPPAGSSGVKLRSAFIDADGTVTVVGGLAADTSTADRPATATIYSLDGRRLTQPARGVNIVRMADGAVKKVHYK